MNVDGQTTNTITPLVKRTLPIDREFKDRQTELFSLKERVPVLQVAPHVMSISDVRINTFAVDAYRLGNDCRLIDHP